MLYRGAGFDDALALYQHFAGSDDASGLGIEHPRGVQHNGVHGRGNTSPLILTEAAKERSAGHKQQLNSENKRVLFMICAR